jgi:hypothetical protein
VKTEQRLSKLQSRQLALVNIQHLMGHNSSVWSNLFIELAGDIMAINNLNNFNEDWIKTIQIRKWCVIS